MCFLCKVSCLEIYQEVITDLLCPERTRLQLREDLRQGIYVDDLSEEVVNDGVCGCPLHAPHNTELYSHTGLHCCLLLLAP